eukprot:gene6023-7353_t
MENSARVFPRICEVRAFVQEKSQHDQGADCHDVEDDHWINGQPIPIAHPMSSYPLYAAKRKSWGINGTVVVEVEADTGEVGVGVSIGGEPACFIIENHLSRFIEGQDPRDVELMWDQMYRATINYGRKGLPLQAISAVDLAIWDLLGKLRNEPVYALLGGKTKDQLPVYMSVNTLQTLLSCLCLLNTFDVYEYAAVPQNAYTNKLINRTSSRPDNAKAFGFVGAKIPCPYGPEEGDEGLKKNVKYFQEWREQVGHDFPLMLDCYMALTPQYTIKLAKELQPFGLKWMEEFLHPDDYDGYVEVKSALAGSGIMLTTGEHEYTRYGFRELIQRKAVDILQPDITWVGGITEARRIVAMAAAYDILCIPHGSSIYSYHLQYINLSPKSDTIVPYFGALFDDEPLPKDGFIQLPDRPGFGVTLNRAKLIRPYVRSNDAVKANYARNIDRPISSTAKLPF